MTRKFKRVIMNSPTEDGGLKSEERILFEVPAWKRRTKYKKGEFCQVNQRKLSELVKDKSLSDVDMRILWGLIATIRFDGGTDVTQKKLAEICGKQQHQISKSLKNLEDNDVIFKDGRSWYINTDLAWKGMEYSQADD